jgi:Glycosyl hydrolase family 76
MGRSAVATLLGFVIASSAAAATAAPAGPLSNAQRAVAGYVAMQRYLFDVRADRYRNDVGGPPTAAAWPVSQALAATIAVAAVPGTNPEFVRGVRARLKTLERFRSGLAYSVVPGWGAFYLDDNEWIAQDLLDWDAIHYDARARSNAVAIFAAAVHAWDGSSSDTCPGGVYWTTTVPGVTDRNAVSTLNGAIVGLRLYAITKTPVYLYWSRRMLDWADGCLLAPNGLYWDHVRPDGSIDQTQWSYNQGAAIGAFTLLYQTTGDATALTRAEGIADTTLANFQQRFLTSEPAAFASIFFRNLLTLAAVDNRQPYVAAAQAYADEVWATRRDPDNGLVAFSAPERLLDQAALTGLYARLARQQLPAAAP